MRGSVPPNDHQMTLFAEMKVPVVAAIGQPRPVFVRRPAVLALPHTVGASPLEPKIIGKLIPHPKFGLVFYHAHSGTQHHRKHRCPAPLDCVLITFLKEQAIEWIYIYDRQGETLYRAKQIQVAAARVELSGNRRRHYLQDHCWQARQGIREEKQQGERRLKNSEGVVILVEPFFRGVPWQLQETSF